MVRLTHMKAPVLTHMKALVAHGYGPAEAHTIAELPIPEPGPGQLQVRIAAASLNPADVRLAAATSAMCSSCHSRTCRATTSPAP